MRKNIDNNGANKSTFPVVFIFFWVKKKKAKFNNRPQECVECVRKGLLKSNYSSITHPIKCHIRKYTWSGLGRELVHRDLMTRQTAE
jgi:hypothetical protein